MLLNMCVDLFLPPSLLYLLLVLCVAAATDGGVSGSPFLLHYLIGNFLNSNLLNSSKTPKLNETLTFSFWFSLSPLVRYALPPPEPCFGGGDAHPIRGGC
ncbi:hypothetical protein SOVF_150610 [Spinacia oleracea]|nr:hypothetical protein SOVF_150610 [Spinacia oleracea]